MNQIFRDREVEKVYHCLVYPKPNWHELDIQLPLLVDADREHRTRVDLNNGKPARSICHVKKFFNTGALVEIIILTGITHQIRAHLRQKELAILGDERYSKGMPPQPIEVNRMMLHARRLSFQHPTTAKRIDITANYPDDFRQAYTNFKMTTAQDEAF
jgi:23S rRNA-/tRNA-specific pseudouridylate synthase